MKIDNIDIEAPLKKVKALIDEYREMSVAVKSLFEIFFLIITLLANRLNLSSKNSSKAPLSDSNREKRTKKILIENYVDKKDISVRHQRKPMNLIR